VAGAAPMQSPAQSLVPLTVPTHLHPIGACGLICAGRLADFGGAVCANAFVAKSSAITTTSPFIAVTEIISQKGVSFRKRPARTRGAKKALANRLVGASSATWRGSYLPFAFSPISTNRRMASERPGSSLCCVAQASTAAIIAGGMRVLTSGSLPVAGRPRFLGVTFFVDDFIFRSYPKFA